METTVETSTLSLPTDQMVATTSSNSQPGTAINQVEDTAHPLHLLKPRESLLTGGMTSTTTNLSCMDTEIPSLASTPCTPQGEAASQAVTTISTSSQPGLLSDLRETVTPITTRPSTSPLVRPPRETAMVAEARGVAPAQIQPTCHGPSGRALWP
jgi:hypothetical protein